MTRIVLPIARSARAAAALLALAALSGSVAAQVTKVPKPVVNQVRDELRLGRMTYKQALNVEVKEILKTIREARDLARAGEATEETAEDLFDDLRAFLGGLDDLAADARLAPILADALFTEGVGGAAFVGDLQRQLAFGTGGDLDVYAERLRVITERAFLKLRAQLSSFSRAALKKSGLHVTFRLRVPDLFRDVSIDPENASFVFEDLPLGIDLAFGVSLVGVFEEGGGGDGLVLISGTSASDELRVSAYRANNTFDFFGVDPTDGRFRVEFGGVTRGNYVLRVATENEEAFAHSAIGVR